MQVFVLMKQAIFLTFKPARLFNRDSTIASSFVKKSNLSNSYDLSASFQQTLLGVLVISSRKVILVLQMSSLVFNTAIIGAATTRRS